MAFTSRIADHMLVVGGRVLVLFSNGAQVGRGDVLNLIGEVPWHAAVAAETLQRNADKTKNKT